MFDFRSIPSWLLRFVALTVLATCLGITCADSSPEASIRSCDVAGPLDFDTHRPNRTLSTPHILLQSAAAITRSAAFTKSVEHGIGNDMRPFEEVTTGTATSQAGSVTSRSIGPPVRRKEESDESKPSGPIATNGSNAAIEFPTRTFSTPSVSQQSIAIPSRSELFAGQSSVHRMGADAPNQRLELALNVEHPPRAVASTAAISQVASALGDALHSQQTAVSSIAIVHPGSVAPHANGLVEEHDAEELDESPTAGVLVADVAGRTLASEIVGDDLQPSREATLGTANVQTSFVISHSVEAVDDRNAAELDDIQAEGSFLADGAHEVARVSSDGAPPNGASTATNSDRPVEGAAAILRNSRFAAVVSSVAAALIGKQGERDDAGISEVGHQRSSGGTLVLVLGIALVGCLICFAGLVFEPKDFDRSGVSARGSIPSRLRAAEKQQRDSTDSLEAASARLLNEKWAPERHFIGSSTLAQAPSDGAPANGLAAPPPTLRSSIRDVRTAASVLAAKVPSATVSTIPAAAPVSAPAPADFPAPPASPTGSPASRNEEQLCPSLVVPDGMEFIFAVPQVVTKERQMTAFSVLDMRGKPLSHVIANERGEAQCGIFLQSLDKTPLALVHTGPLHERKSLPDICRPSGEVFCSLVCDGTPNCCRYLLKHQDGRRLLAFHGDFREKATNVVNASGGIVCATERCNTDFDGASHYQVRVAPHVDAGLVLCGLLAIDKLEGSNSAAPAQPTFTDVA